MRAYLLSVAALTLSVQAAALQAESLTVSGKTMGTTYNVTVVDAPDGVDAISIENAITASLDDTLSKMNNWNPTSEISIISAAQNTQPVEISADLETVLTEANRIHALSDGKFDITLAPLINLWGFGPKKPGDPIPSETEIAEALALVGQSDKLALENGTLTKALPGVSVNLSAIAKGYGVDQIGAALETIGIDRYLVEIGGDLAAKGLKDGNKPWVIGIERPDAARQTVETVIPVTDLGLATSGDYRNYFEEDGVRYSHIIDPTTGRPITHTTASVTVLADSAMTADGLATALLVVGSDAAMRIAEAEGIAVMTIDRKGDAFEIVTSPAFDALLAKTGN